MRGGGVVDHLETYVPAGKKRKKKEKFTGTGGKVSTAKKPRGHRSSIGRDRTPLNVFCQEEG